MNLKVKLYSVGSIVKQQEVVLIDCVELGPGLQHLVQPDQVGVVTQIHHLDLSQQHLGHLWLHLGLVHHLQTDGL